MNAIRILLLLVGGGLFLVSAIAYVIVKIKLKPSEDAGIDDVYYEFEDAHPQLARYNRWSQITFGGAVIGALLLFLSIAF